MAYLSVNDDSRLIRRLDGSFAKIHGFKGRVVGSKLWSETHVTGSGGTISGGFGPGETLRSEPVSISSKVVTQREFFIHDDGQEMSVQFSDRNFPVHDGQIVGLLWLVAPETKRGPYVVAFNENTDSVEEFGISESALSGPNFRRKRSYVWLIGLLSMLVSVGLDECSNYSPYGYESSRHQATIWTLTATLGLAILILGIALAILARRRYNSRYNSAQDTAREQLQNCISKLKMAKIGS